MLDDITLARALHVAGLVHWIGGLAFVTLVVLPLALSRSAAAGPLSLFDAVEQRFSAQVRISIPLVGATGLWMTYRMDLWDRFVDPGFWWMTAMFGLWAVFMIMVFVLEPALHGWFEQQARDHPHAVLRRMTVLHGVLLALATLTVLGAVAGSHGLSFI